jgi:predicted lipoprotein
MSRSRFFLVLALVGTWFAVSWSCGDTPTVASYDRAALLQEVTEQVIVPGYTAVHQDAQALQDTSRTLCAKPGDATLKAARAAWKKLFLAWQDTAAYNFGPADDQNLGPEMASWPIKPDAIEQQISGKDPIDQDTIDALGGGSKGIYAIEYLLYGPHASVGELSDERRCTYLTALAEHVQRTSQTLLTAWTSSKDGFAHTLSTAGEAGNDTYPAQLSAVSVLVTGIVTTIENVKDSKLGTPLGLSASSTQIDPSAVESPYAELSVAAMQANMKSIRAIWKGTSHNFDAYLRTRNEKLADQVLAQLESVDKDLTGIPEPFSKYVAGKDHSEGKTAHDDLDTLERLYTTDVDVAFAVNLMFNSNDGD